MAAAKSKPPADLIRQRAAGLGADMLDVLDVMAHRGDVGADDRLRERPLLAGFCPLPPAAFGRLLSAAKGRSRPKAAHRMRQKTAKSCHL